LVPLLPGDERFPAALFPDERSGGLFLLDGVDLFNIVCVPGLTSPAAVAAVQAYCHTRRAFLIADCERGATVASLQGESSPAAALTGEHAMNCAFYFPWVLVADPLQGNQPAEVPPCGFIAGIYARTDAARGVWKAPAGVDARLVGAAGTAVPLTGSQIATLNPKAINCIRTLPQQGIVAWGARTLHGDDRRASDWKYVPVRRTALFIEESIRRGLSWTAAEPNGAPLWTKIRTEIGEFLHGLLRQGAFAGRTPREAFFVKCDAETTTQDDIDRGIVNALVGFAPLKPAEFVIIRLDQVRR
jgi:hypothetical protein